MHADDILGPAKTLREFVDSAEHLPSWAWIYTQERGDVSFSTLCRAILTASQELSEEEAEMREAALEKEGFRCLLCRDQIEDILANLRYRCPDATGAQTEEAVRFFLVHDAFIV